MIPEKPINSIWSDEQWQAIHAHGKNILINAGAGSGKTTVLTERIIQILKKKVGLDQLIVLTFTKAAASEMKERIRHALKKEVDKGEDLQEALDYVDQSSIQTFDSFALSLVRKYHYLLGVDRSISIGDSVIFKSIKKQIIDEVFEDCYNKDHQGFLNLINLFCIKNDDKVKEYITNINDKLDLIADKDEFLDHYLDHFYSEDIIKKNIDEFINLIALDLDRIKVRLNRLKMIITDEVLLDHLYALEESLSGLLKSRTYNDFINNINVKIPSIPRKVEDENQKAQVSFEKDNIKKLIASIASYLNYPNTESMFYEIQMTKPYCEVIIEIIHTVNSKYNTFKKNNNIYEFMDIAKLAIKLMKENYELCESIKKHTYEILIDEYQDTSDIQEILINYIANNNVYMVGDMKQSIYRFRNANPDIFKTKYQDFKSKNNGLAIDLSKNFRSREEVLNNINLIFSQVMSMEIGGVDYDESHRLQFANKVYLSNKPYNSYDMEIYYYDYDEKTVEKDKKLNQHELEAFIVANDIKKKIALNYLIYDKDQKLTRPLRYSDITILTAEKGQFDLYKKIFEFLQIPLIIHKDENFVRSTEIYAVKNLLRCVYSLYDNNYYQDNFRDALFSILRSFVLEVDDITISKIFSQDLIEGLKLHCIKVYEDLTNISSDIQNSTSSQILGEIYQTFNIYEKIVKISNVEQVENKLNHLLLKFKELDELGYKLIDIINYLEGIIDEKTLDIEYSPSKISKDNVVNMMTIHKSKGLEFPICYFPELDVKFNFSDTYEKVLFDKNYGIILPVFDDGLKDTFYKDLYKQKYKIEEISERLRVLYVALTRAKEKIIIVLPKYEESFKVDDKLVPVVDRVNYKKFFDVFSSVSNSLKDFSYLATPNILTKDYEIISNLNQINIENPKEIVKKQVVLRKQEEKHMVASMVKSGLIGKEAIKIMDLGTKIHEFLEVIDINGDVSKQIESLYCDKNIKEKLFNFYNLDFFKTKKIIRTYHEHQFTYQEDNSVINGIIDLILETDNELIIVDYKLSDITKKEYEKQLNVYKKYLEQIASKPISGYLYSILQNKLKKVY